MLYYDKSNSRIFTVVRRSLIYIIKMKLTLIYEDATP